MGKITLLNELNAIGEELGYPFYLFEDGSYGNKFVNGKMNAIAVIKKPFDEITLHKAPNCAVSHEMPEDETEKISVLPKTPEEAMAKLPVDKRQTLQTLILYAKAGQLSQSCSHKEADLFFQYASSSDIMYFLVKDWKYSRKFCNWRIEKWLSNPFVDITFIKRYLSNYKDKMLNELDNNMAWDKGITLGGRIMKEIRWDLALWFMITFCLEVASFNKTQEEMEYYFVKRALGCGDIYSIEQYVRRKTSLSKDAEELLVHKVANDTKLYHWYEDVYLPMTQKSA